MSACADELRQVYDYWQECTCRGQEVSGLTILSLLSTQTSVLIEQDNTASIMGHIEMTRQVLVLEVLNCLLQCDDVRFLRNVLLSMAPFPRQGPGFQLWMLSFLLLSRAIGHVAVKMILWALQRVLSGWCIAERWIGHLRIDNLTPKSDLGVRLHPCR